MFTVMTTLDTATRKLLKDPKRRRDWVIYQLTLRDRTLADVARAAGVHRQTLYHAFTRPYPRMERTIADSIGLTPQALFAERYDEHGLPTRRKGIGNGRRAQSLHGGKDTRARQRCNAQVEKVA